eukprot:CFRG0581T1
MYTGTTQVLPTVAYDQPRLLPGDASVLLVPITDDVDVDGEPLRRFQSGTSISSSGSIAWDRKGDSDGIMTPWSENSLDLFDDDTTTNEVLFENIGLSASSWGIFRDREVILNRSSFKDRFGATFVAYQEKLYVIHVVSQSPADFAGLHFGHEVVSINGKTAKRFDTWTAGIEMTRAVAMSVYEDRSTTKISHVKDEPSAAGVSTSSMCLSLKEISLDAPEDTKCTTSQQSPLPTGFVVNSGFVDGEACHVATGTCRNQLLSTRLKIRQASFLRTHLILGTAKQEPIGIDFVFGNITYVVRGGRAHRAGIRPNHTILFVDELSCMGGFNAQSTCRDQDIVNFIHRSSGDIEITTIPTAVLSELLRDVDYTPPIPNTQLQSDDEL